MSLAQLQAAPPFIADGGLETTLIYRQGVDLPDFAACPLLDTEAGRDHLVDYASPIWTWPSAWISGSRSTPRRGAPVSTGRLGSATTRPGLRR